MGERGAGLTLEALAQRLETLERENERMRSENDALKSKIDTLEGSDTRRNGPTETSSLVPLGDGERASGFEGRLSRRSLLSKAGVAAAGLVVAGALTQTDIREAQAAQIIGDSTEGFRGGVEGTNNAVFGYGVRGRATDGWGVDGEADRAGVRGHSTKGKGVEGSGPTGVFGFGTGQFGSGSSGVKGRGDVGVHGESSTLGWSSVYGGHIGEAGYGVTGDGKGSGAGVLGRNPDGPGIEARDSVYGGKFSGSRAQLMLVPGGSLGKPTTGTHTKGEIYMDKAGALFVCTAGNGTSVGTWKKVNMKLV